MSRRSFRIVAVATSCVATLAAFPTSATAHPKPVSDSPQVIATGLDNPRHLRFSDGGLYVAESGRGGSGPCLTSPEGPACYGATGSITRVRSDGQRRVVTGLPSIAGPGGVSANGPADVRVRGRRFDVVLGLGNNPAVRATLPGNGKKLGTVSSGRLGRSGLSVKVDVGAYEASANPDRKQIDTNPVALVGDRSRHGRRDVVVDAGGNSLLGLTRRGGLRTLAVFPSTQVPGPSGALMPMDAVPTAAAYGPDGAIYVSQLTGFPFPVGGASIWKVRPGQAPTKYATGLTNVTDLAFGRDGSLYAVQLADQGLPSGSTGSVVRIPWGGGARHRTVVSGLKAPYGIALHSGAAYVTTCSTCAGEGEVLRVPLRRR
jgi:hypothetical protein